MFDVENIKETRNTINDRFQKYVLFKTILFSYIIILYSEFVIKLILVVNVYKKHLLFINLFVILKMKKHNYGMKISSYSILLSFFVFLEKRNYLLQVMIMVAILIKVKIYVVNINVLKLILVLMIQTFKIFNN
jgi:hypothetical protein